MHKDRIKGAAQKTKGAVQDVACKVTGDTKLQAEGKADKVADKVQNVVGPQPRHRDGAVRELPDLMPEKTEVRVRARDSAKARRNDQQAG